MRQVYRLLLKPPLLLILCASPILAGEPRAASGKKRGAAPVARTTPGKKRVQPLQTQGDAVKMTPAEAAASVPFLGDAAAEISTAEALAAAVPGSGPLSERHLILLAIANNPDLEKLRGDIRIAKAEEQAAHDLKNPELRFTYGWQNDDTISSPYTERGRESLSSSESFGEFDTSSIIGDTGIVPGNGVNETRSGNVGTTRFREIERRVTPGRYQDKIETITYERRDSSGSSVRSKASESNPANPTREAHNENTSRRIASRSVETVNHPDAFGRGESFNILLRFQPPHPWERKAAIQRALAEISLAEAKYLAEEDKVVRTVRELYSKISLTRSEQAAELKRKGIQEGLSKELLTYSFDPSAAFDASRAEQEGMDAMMKAAGLGANAGVMQGELAGFCGVADPSRIAPEGITIRRVMEGDHLSVAYLTDMAMVYRADILESRARMEIARAMLAEVKAARIPFATFIDAGWGRQWSDGRTGTQDEWMIRVGMSFPIFDWIGLNKKHKVYEESQRSWERQIEKQRQQITNEITVLLNNLSLFQRNFSTVDSQLKQAQERAAKAVTGAQINAALPDLPGFGPNANDLNKSKRFEFQKKDMEQVVEIRRYKNWQNYNDTVLQLERVIGVRLEKILPSVRSSK